MKRELAMDSTLILECGYHKVRLDPTDGPPYCIPAGVQGGWRLDPSDMDCPALPDDASESERSKCADSWRAWTDA